MRNANNIGSDLRRWMRRRKITEHELAQRVSAENEDFPVTQSWVSRIIRGEFRRPTERVRSVAAYANIQIFERKVSHPEGEKIIRDAVSRSWDGSLSHAAVIARLIRAARDLDRTRR